MSSQPKRPSLLDRLADSSDQPQPAACSTEYAHSDHAETAAPSSFRCNRSPAVTGQCPVCGLRLPTDLLQAHVEKELSLLVDCDTGSVPPATASQVGADQSHQEAPLQPTLHQPRSWQESDPCSKVTKTAHAHWPQHNTQKVRLIF